MARSVLVFLGLSLVAALLFVTFYEMHDFRPYLSQINDIYRAMDPGDRQSPAQVRDFVWKVNGPETDSFVSRKLLGEVRHPRSMMAWHYHSIMWGLMLRLHFDRNERLAFYCHYLPYEGGVGFSKASLFYFARPLDTLSVDEVATIVTVGRAPQINSPTRHPEQFQASKRYLLDSYGSQK